jgi:hypothetical protein
MIDSTAVRVRIGSPMVAKGAQAHALGRTRDGPGAKNHALSDN